MYYVQNIYYGSSYSWDFTQKQQKKDASLKQTLLVCSYVQEQVLLAPVHSCHGNQEEQEAPGREEVQTVPEMLDASGLGEVLVPAMWWLTPFTLECTQTKYL